MLLYPTKHILMMKKFLFLVLIIVVAGIAGAWDGRGHEYLAERVCSGFAECRDCLATIKNASTYPDRVFNDKQSHHFYDPASCVESENYTCPVKYDDVALRKADGWLNKSAQDSGCGRWFDIGVASHYFFDSKVIWHQVQKEPSDCHSDFEEKVGNRLSGNRADWEVCECGQCVNSDDFPRYVEEFESKVVSYNPNLTRAENNEITGRVTDDGMKNQDIMTIITIIIVILLIIFLVWFLSRR